MIALREGLSRKLPLTRNGLSAMISLFTVGLFLADIAYSHQAVVVWFIRSWSTNDDKNSLFGYEKNLLHPRRPWIEVLSLLW